MKSYSVTMIVFALLIPQLCFSQVGKRTKLSGQKNKTVDANEHVIQIGNVRLTPADARAFASQGKDRYLEQLVTEGEQIVIVGKFDGVDQGFQAKLESTFPKFNILERGRDSVVVLAQSQDARSLPLFEGVDIVEVLTAERKLSSELREIVARQSKTKGSEETPALYQLQPLNLSPLENGPVLNGGAEGVEVVEPKIDVNFYLFGGQDLEKVKGVIADSNGTVSNAGSDGTITVVRAKIPVNAILQVAEEHSVREVTRDVRFIKHNDIAQRILVRNPPMYVPSLKGSGQIVGHSDSGLDNGANDATLHNSFVGRLKKAFALGRPDTNNWSDRGGHGTHTAGSIVGLGTFPGIAPEAQLVHQSLDNENGDLTGIPAPLGSLFQQAYDEGARVHSNSWGVSAFDSSGNNVRGGKYSIGQEVDAWTWNNGDPKDMLILFSAGNDGDENASMTVGAPGTAKNCLTVGACENRRPAGGTSGDSVDDLASFSSQGPTREGRIKPDVVAPGTWIASAKTQAAETVWQDDIESATVGNAAGDWIVTPGFSLVTQSTDAALSGSQAFRLSRTMNSKFNDVLQTPEIAVPAGHNLTAEVWCRGDMTGLDSLQFGFVASSGLLVYPSVIRRDFDQWTVMSFPIADSLEGTTMRLAVVARETGGLPDDIEWFVDDFRITTFGSWGALSTLGMAMPNDANDTAFTLSGGTSMATPLSAGCAVLVRQSLVASGETTPTAELIKSILINSADAHQGGRPNFQSGWGLVNLRRAIEEDFLFDYQSSLASDDDFISYDIDVPNGATELRATLVWADAPGGDLVNDLDLSVISPSGTLIRAADQAGISPDRTNNVEGIDHQSPETGTWKVRVARHRISQGEAQPFAMVVSILD